MTSRPGDFTAIWPLLSERARVLIQDLVRTVAVADTERVRVDLHDIVRRAPGLTAGQRKDMTALLALLEDNS